MDSSTPEAGAEQAIEDNIASSTMDFSTAPEGGGQEDTVSSTVFSFFVSYLTGNFPYSPELQAFFMALFGAMAVRTGPNRNRTMNWFHAFMLSIISGYAGGTFGFLWMGKPTAMISNDLNLAACILAFVIANYMPFDLGFKISRLLPVAMVTACFAQLFRSLGIIKFATVAFEAFRDSPSAYYPIPVFGPIVYATLLGNMGGFFTKGFHAHLENGMPWPFQQGLVCASFYHFFVHDQTGFIGITLRNAINVVPGMRLGLDDKTFATVVVVGFMQVMGILQLPTFLGPAFSPFTVIPNLVVKLMEKVPKAEVDYTGNNTKKASKAGGNKKEGGSAAVKKETKKDL